MSSRSNYCCPFLPPASCRYIFQTKQCGNSVLISFQIEQALQKESGTAMLRIRDGQNEEPRIRRRRTLSNYQNPLNGNSYDNNFGQKFASPIVYKYGPTLVGNAAR